MKKTYVTTMPNHIGAFLKASKCFAELGINITRVSYDKSVDSHMLFLDVEGTEEQILKADEELEKIARGVEDTLKNELFIKSGAADCGALEKIYTSKVEENKTNLEYLNGVLKVFMMR